MSNSSDRDFFEELPGWAKVALGFAVLGGGVYLVKHELEEIDKDVVYIYHKLKRSKDDALFAIEKLVRDRRYKVGQTGSDTAWSHFKSELSSRASSEPFVRKEDVQEVLSYGERERKNMAL